MEKVKSLKSHSFLQLSRLVSERKRALAASKINRENPELVGMNQKLFDEVKKAIIEWKA